jgi:hypothetical protein
MVVIMGKESSEKDWKLRFRYGKTATPYKHFTLIAEGVVSGPLEHRFSCPTGGAFMGMKV